MIHSDSDYAINTCTGKWSGHFNVQLYLQIRHFIDDLHVCIESLRSSQHSVMDSLSKLSTFSFRKVRAHSGIRGNEKAVLLAKKGQNEVCTIGRYSAVLVNSLRIAKSLNSSPKCLEGETFFSLNNISKNLGDEGLDDKNDKYETTNNHIFSAINLDSHSATECGRLR